MPALLGFVTVGFGWASFWAQAPDIKAQIGADDGFFSLLLLLGAFGAVSAMVSAPIVHRLIGPWSMGLTSVLMGLGFCLACVATTPLVFTLGLFTAAAMSGVADVIANAEVSEVEAETGRSLMNLNHGLFSVAYALAAFLVGFAREASWSPVAICGTMAIVVAAFALFMRLPVRRSDETTPSASGLPLGIVWLGGLVVMAAFLGEAASEGWSALHIERTLGGSPSQGSFGPAILAITMAVGRLGGHVLVGNQPPLKVMAVALMLAVFGLGLVGVAPGIGLVYVGFGLAGLGVSVVGPLALGLVGQVVPERLRLAAISRAAALGYGAFFVGPPLMGFVAEGFGLRVSFFVAAAILLVVVVLILPLWATRLREGKAAAAAP